MSAIFPAMTNGGGQCMAAPDVCLTPAPPPVGQVPVPYPNNGMMNQAQKTSKTVKFAMKEVIKIMSEIPRFDSAELIIPRSARGYNPDEFLYFSLDKSLDASKFRVLLEDLAGRWVNLGNPTDRVFVPNTYWPEKAMLIVVGQNSGGEQVRFLSTLKRGNHYALRGSQGGDRSAVMMIPTSC